MAKQHPNSKPKANHPWKAQDSREIAAHRINSRAKGAAAEREFAALLLDLLGVKLARNLEQSRSGGHDLEAVGDDPAALALRRFAIECKRYAAIPPAMLAKFWEQAESQARRASRVPALAFRADRQEWRVVVPLSALNGEVYGEAWGGIEWTAVLSVPAFCALVRDKAHTPTAGSLADMRRQVAESLPALREIAERPPQAGPFGSWLEATAGTVAGNLGGEPGP